MRHAHNLPLGTPIVVPTKGLELRSLSRQFQSWNPRSRCGLPASLVVAPGHHREMNFENGSSTRFARHFDSAVVRFYDAIADRQP